jgi:hypothetical protein
LVGPPLLQASSLLLGQSRGREVRVVVHHSRNSEQKQWDETVVIALGGMARLLRAHLPAIVGMDHHVASESTLAFPCCSDPPSCLWLSICDVKECLCCDPGCLGLALHGSPAGPWQPCCRLPANGGVMPPGHVSAYRSSL